ncbi:MAG: hypothetical protein SFX74_06190 [Fimbriimonadaceae bacterium]|nr:hypothetical protein [Fimbriimonadaceae bacterium]
MDRVFGVDFTSAPKPGHPIVVVEGQRLAARRWEFAPPVLLTDWTAFEQWLRLPGPWLAGLDFPLGLPAAFCDRCGWTDLAAIQAAVRAMTRDEWRDYVRQNPPRDLRPDDAAWGGASPLNVVNPPVGLMYYEGARRVWDAGLALPGISPGDPNRVAIEVYPGAVAAELLPRSPHSRKSKPYKGRPKGVRPEARAAHRERLLRALRGWARCHGVEVEWSAETEAMAHGDDQGDALDALMAAAVTAWATDQPRYGTPNPSDSRVGGIVMPAR